MTKKGLMPLLAVVLLVSVVPGRAPADDNQNRTFPAIIAQQGDPNCECPPPKCVFLDVFDPDHDSGLGAPPGGWILPAGSSNGVSVGVLTAGKPYLVTITGTVSYFAMHGFHSWDWLPILGTPVLPLYLSDGPGAPAPSLQEKTSQNFECGFAFPTWPGSPAFGWTLPIHAPLGRVSLDGGVTFSDRTPIGPVCSPSHTYQYLLMGEGKEAFFRTQDTGPTNDNYGKFKICVEPARVSPACP